MECSLDGRQRAGIGDVFSLDSGSICCDTEYLVEKVGSIDRPAAGQHSSQSSSNDAYRNPDIRDMRSESDHRSTDVNNAQQIPKGCPVRTSHPVRGWL